jgi:hypothetical protein
MRCLTRATVGGFAWLGLRLQYKAEWGHCNVVLGSTLGRWVYLQRDLAEEGKLSEERAAKLGAAG